MALLFLPNSRNEIPQSFNAPGNCDFQNSERFLSVFSVTGKFTSRHEAPDSYAESSYREFQQVFVSECSGTGSDLSHGCNLSLHGG